MQLSQASMQFFCSLPDFYTMLNSWRTTKRRSRLCNVENYSIQGTEYWCIRSKLYLSSTEWTVSQSLGKQSINTENLLLVSVITLITVAYVRSYHEVILLGLKSTFMLFSNTRRVVLHDAGRWLSKDLNNKSLEHLRSIKCELNDEVQYRQFRTWLRSL